MKDIEDEIPFAVPEGWAWCRLPEVCRKPITDGTHNSPPNSASGDFLYITAKNIKNLAICLDDATYVSKETHESIYSRCSPELNDVLLTKDGTIGEVAVNNLNYPFSMLSSVALIKPSNGILPWFLAYILISDLLQNKMKKNAKGSALKRIILAQINNFIIPLPPLAEQQRIVAKIETIFAQVDLLEQNKVDLQTAVKQAKSKILDLAIRGKLVKQDPADEPASMMLEKLRAEKEAKIAAGEVKRDKNDSYIYRNPTDNCYYEKFDGKNDICINDDIPFELPKNWQWCRFGNYIDVRDGTHDSPKYVETGYPFITSKNLINGKIDFSNVQYITEKDHNNYIQRSYVEDDDILFAMIGSIGNPVLIKKDREFSIKNVALFKPYEKKHTDMKFVLFFLSWIQEYLRKIAKGGMQPFIPLNLFRKEIFIPIPPISEQKRIITKIEVIFNILDDIQSNLA